jgi:hypothetical protein
MTEAIELYKQDGTATGVFFCSECRAVFPNREQAEGCHGERICKCGKPIDRRYYATCSECSNAAFDAGQQEKEKVRYEKAEKVPYADYKGGMLFDGDKYFSDLEEMEDHYYDAPLPEYVWACEDVGVPKATSESIVENLLENMWEDADHNDLNGLDELDAAIAKFNEANESINVWEPDYKTAVLIPRPKQGGEL